jgi:hypothetical protein
MKDRTVHAKGSGAGGPGIVNQLGLAKLVLIVVASIGLAIWLKSERSQALYGCQTCPTDISASRR